MECGENPKELGSMDMSLYEPEPDKIHHTQEQENLVDMTPTTAGDSCEPMDQDTSLQHPESVQPEISPNGTLPKKLAPIFSPGFKPCLDNRGERRQERRRKKPEEHIIGPMDRFLMMKSHFYEG